MAVLKQEKLELLAWSEMCVVIGISGICQENLRAWNATVDGYKLLLWTREGKKKQWSYILCNRKIRMYGGELRPQEVC